VEDSVESFVKDTLKSGQGLSEEPLVQLLVEKSAEAVSFLSSFDIPLDVISRCGGHSASRTHRNGPDARGRYVWQNLRGFPVLDEASS
jgi:aspartate oxidase